MLGRLSVIVFVLVSLYLVFRYIVYKWREYDALEDLDIMEEELNVDEKKFDKVVNINEKHKNLVSKTKDFNNQ